SKQRYRFGKMESFNKSRFVGEMRGVQSTVRFANSSYGAGYDAPKRTTFGTNDAKNIYSSSYQTKTGVGGFAKQTPAKKSTSGINYDAYRKDVIVEHSKFGRGLIISTSGEGEDKIASIAFKGLGVKRFSLAVAAPLLKIIENK
ncbi:MAG: hypothetical protein II867_02200, partial [Clostridia bacterium]|nr:hypothetical protein [Clostridia bacterium]